VQTLCSRVGIINHGKIIAVDSIKSLGQKLSVSGSKTVFVSYEDISEKALKAIQKLEGVISIKEDRKNKRLEIDIESGKSIIPIINKTLVKHDINVTGIESHELNLEDIFLSLTGEK
jgi:ABC-2 type transport system ATP-binding protein